jgi:ornithine cyclodeaminase
VVGVVTRALLSYARGHTILPAEGYLAWQNSRGCNARSLAMLGAVTDPDDSPHYGVKVINAAVDNPARGIDRAGGVIMLFDPETARPKVLADAAVLSALRTAGYTMATIRVLGPAEPTSVAVIGCGALARAHLELLARCCPSVDRAFVYDISAERMQALADWVAAEGLGITVQPADSAADCVGRSDLLITVTVSDTPYIESGWFTAPTFVAHVSLDDLTPAVLAGAAAIYVDDIGLVADNPRRILGRMIADGRITTGPGSRAQPYIRGTLASVLCGNTPAERPGSGHVISNPFGMAVLDVALAAAVHDAALGLGMGYTVDLTR